MCGQKHWIMLGVRTAIYHELGMLPFFSATLIYDDLLELGVIGDCNGGLSVRFLITLGTFGSGGSSRPESSPSSPPGGSWPCSARSSTGFGGGLFGWAAGGSVGFGGALKSSPLIKSFDSASSSPSILTRSVISSGVTLTPCLHH